MECARGLGVLFPGLFRSTAVPALSPCPFAVRVEESLAAVIGDRAGALLEGRARQEPGQLPGRTQAGALVMGGSPRVAGACGRRRLKTATRQRASWKTLWTRVSSRAAWDLSPGEGCVQSRVVFTHSAWSRFTAWHGRVVCAGGRSCCNAQR